MNADFTQVSAKELEARRQALLHAVSSDELILVVNDTGEDTTNLLKEIMGTSHVPFIKETEQLFDEQVRFASGKGKDFRYLTGFEAEGWVLLLDAQGKSASLLKSALDSTKTLFEGDYSAEKAAISSGVTDIISPKDYLKSFKSRTIMAAPEARKQLAKLRAIKNAGEIQVLEEAIQLTTKSFAQVKERIQNRSVQMEYHIDALFTYDFRFKGAYHGYEPIVAGGRNALTLHYGKNSESLPGNGLILMDIGASVNGYSADITRTYAIGTPSKREVAVHAAVEKAHFAIINLIKPGVLLKDYQDASDEIMKEALRGLGLLNAPEDYRKYFPHAISHGLGIDVHESLGGYEKFQPGMVLTVEPGIYIPEEGIGVRIEDDILVTETGTKNLSGHLPTSL